jgi:hypothetical protein
MSLGWCQLTIHVVGRYGFQVGDPSRTSHYNTFYINSRGLQGGDRPRIHHFLLVIARDVLGRGPYFMMLAELQKFRTHVSHNRMRHPIRFALGEISFRRGKKRAWFVIYSVRRRTKRGQSKQFFFK